MINTIHFNFSLFFKALFLVLSLVGIQFSNFKKGFFSLQKKNDIILFKVNINMEFKPIHMVIPSFKFMSLIENITLSDLRIIKMNRALVRSKWIFNTCNTKTKWGNLVLPNIIFNIHGMRPSISSDEV